MTFQECVAFVLKWESWKSNDAKDPGSNVGSPKIGTVWGISERDFPNEVAAMWDMSQEDSKKVAAGIYRKKYWEPAGCDAYDPPWNLIVFDTAVNCGVSRALKWLDEEDTWQGYLFRRLKHYTSLDIFKHFGKGWVNRVIDLYKTVGKTV